MSENSEHPGSNAEIVYENEQFRTTKWTISPGGHIPMHRHDYEYVVVPLSDNVMHVITGDADLIEAVMVPGTAYGRPKGSEHRCENRGETDIVFIEVESLTS